MTWSDTWSDTRPDTRPDTPLRVTRWVLLILGCAIALRVHALAMGFAMDDYAQLAMLAGGYPVERAPWDLFSFCDGSAAEVSRQMDAGGFPWWTDPELRLSTMRPLASLLIWFDVRVLGGDARVLHAHTLLWWIALLVVASRLLLQVLPARWALVAFALYALDECHAQPLAWLANRNAIVAAVFGVAAVSAHVRWREHGEVAARRWTVTLLVLALAAGESALGAAGFIAAYELTAVPRAKWRGCWPHAIVLLGWAAIHRGAGYGAARSGVYLDPATDPWGWSVEAVVRGPILLADLAFALPTGELALGGRGFLVQGIAGGVALLGALVWLRRGRRDAAAQARLRWFALATVLSLLPMLSAFVSARLLVLPALGAHVLLAACVLDGAHASASLWSRRVLALVALIAHGVLAPWWGVRELAQLRAFGDAARRAALAMPIDPDVPQRVVVLAVADPSTLLYPGLVRAAHGAPPPAGFLVLSAAPGPHRLRRVDARTLELEVEGGMLRSHVEAMFRRADRLPAVGTVIHTPDAELEIRAVDAGGFPTRLQVRFATALEDRRRIFVIATPAGLVRYPLGPIGAWLLLPPASAPR
ncbi:MAG: hypothetical protein JNK45_13900 [Myxococcales bacterium]|jgi:hypothetical protein|nr:hypothetical protein [Myxococcales bacterium]